MRLEGGFQGRPNKLVDGCYSFWVGAVFPLLQTEAPLYQTEALQDYVLVCAQVALGGLRDKPGKGRDYYHTCYCLSGLASAQHAARPAAGAGADPDPDPFGVYHPANMLEPTHPTHNIMPHKVDRIKAYFAQARLSA